MDLNGSFHLMSFIEVLIFITIFEAIWVSSSYIQVCVSNRSFLFILTFVLLKKRIYS
ncbi:hypothetical protein CLU79DRAFT_769558 [Phycomyces nitens]|nr:hypothetical protein CLU79DRAFT_769558 [Phycomyces nitens]